MFSHLTMEHALNAKSPRHDRNVFGWFSYQSHAKKCACFWEVIASCRAASAAHRDARPPHICPSPGLVFFISLSKIDRSKQILFSAFFPSSSAFCAHVWEHGSVRMEVKERTGTDPRPQRRLEGLKVVVKPVVFRFALPDHLHVLGPLVNQGKVLLSRS